MNRYLKAKQIEPELSQKVQAYLSYCLMQDKARVQEVEEQLI